VHHRPYHHQSLNRLPGPVRLRFRGHLRRRDPPPLLQATRLRLPCRRRRVHHSNRSSSSAATCPSNALRRGDGEDLTQSRHRRPVPDPGPSPSPYLDLNLTIEVDVAIRLDRYLVLAAVPRRRLGHLRPDHDQGAGPDLERDRGLDPSHRRRLTRAHNHVHVQTRDRDLFLDRGRRIKFELHF